VAEPSGSLSGLANLQRGSFRRQSLSGSDEFPYSQCGKLYHYRNVRCTVTDQTRKKTRNY